MTEHTRRTVLKAAGASTLAVGIAGCTGGDDGSDENGTENGDENGGDGHKIEAGETILFEGHIAGWEGVQPAAIEGETNPTIILEADAEYEIGWEQGDGNRHNIVLWNEDEELVDEEYATEQTSEPGDPFSFTASEELAYYRCEPHTNMQGEIQIE